MNRLMSKLKCTTRPYSAARLKLNVSRGAELQVDHGPGLYSL